MDWSHFQTKNEGRKKRSKLFVINCLEDGVIELMQMK